jgi:hypothetical protein
MSEAGKLGSLGTARAGTMGRGRDALKATGGSFGDAADNFNATLA